MESLVRNSALDLQQELLGHYCSEAEALIGQAASRVEAKRISQKLCSRPQQKCESKLVLAATEGYIDGIISKMFDGKP